MIVAPASKAAWLLSICSETVIGTAGLSDLVGKDPVMAQHKMQGLEANSDIEENRFVLTLKVDCMGVTRLCFVGD